MKMINPTMITFLLALIGALLFYNEWVGVNIFVFTAISATVAAYMHGHNSSIKILLSIAPSMVCSIFIAIYPQSLTYNIWLFCYLIMWTTIALDLKPILTPLHSIYSVSTSPGNKIVQTLFYRNQSPSPKNRSVSIYAITALILISFFILYATSNPVLSKIVSVIDLSFINIDFLLLTVLLFIVLLGMVELRINDRLSSYNEKPIRLLPAINGQRDQNGFNLGRLSIWSVSILLAVVNFIDLGVLISGKLPEGMSYSTFVHQGFYSLIFSISLAIGLVIYFFRGQINFHEKIDVLRKASYFWIMQNLLLAFITGYKNYLYVEVYGLTYKRFAVFPALICVIIGLILSIQKVKSPYTNWHFFNRLAHYAFVALVAISLLPYDHVITSYNLNYAQRTDLNYLLRLEMPDLSLIDNYIKTHDYVDQGQAQKVQKRIYSLQQKATDLTWLSWNMYLEHYKPTK